MFFQQVLYTLTLSTVINFKIGMISAVCAKRTRSVAHRLAKTPHLLKLYNNIIEEQESRGFIERVSSSSTCISTSTHYIPHHPVRKESLTTPIRIVYNCSCKQFPDLPSLNDCLNSGPHALMISVPFSYIFINTILPSPQT